MPWPSWNSRTGSTCPAIYAKLTKEDKLKAANALARTYQESQQKSKTAANLCPPVATKLNVEGTERCEFVT